MLRFSLLALLSYCLAFPSLAPAASSVKPELLPLQKEYERRTTQEMDSVARWYTTQLQELKTQEKSKTDPDTAAAIQRELATRWYHELLGRPPSNFGSTVPVWLPLEKLQTEAQARRAKALDPITRKYRTDIDTIARRAERDSDTDGQRLARAAWRAAFPLEPTTDETSTWFAGTRWAWWKAETVEVEAGGSARYLNGANVREVRWKLRDPVSIFVRFGTEDPEKGGDVLEMFWTHCIMHAKNGKTWRINRLDLLK